MTAPQDRTVAEVLWAAADLIEPEGAWTQDVHARNEFGEEAEGREDAVCFCLLGAISFVCGADPQDEVGSREHTAMKQVVGYDLPGWNDSASRTQQQVVQAFREAAALAEAQS